MFAITTAMMVTVCGILIGLGCWLPPRADGLTVAALHRRLVFESYCRELGSQWPARTEAELDHERVLTRLHAIVGPHKTRGGFTPRSAAVRHVKFGFDCRFDQAGEFAGNLDDAL
ncbi:hypothetical protein [Nocardia spumae]|uniref:hypothetical protein n=1 Tax=Nocardia spumae TaxID=2887190 RepID=UPI001D1427DD|nr:hypothetical protein [Nocardia spumae]